MSTDLVIPQFVKPMSPEEAAAVEAVAVAAREVERLEREFTRMNRAPFRKILAQLINAAPTEENIREFAKKNPDKWASAVGTIATLAGFEKGAGVNINLYNLGEMSDSQLMERREALRKKLKVTEVVDAEVVQDSAVSTEREQTPKVNK